MKKILTLIAAAAALVACSKNESSTQAVPDASRPVKFSVENLYSLTTKGEMADQSQVAIYAGAPISKDNVSMRVVMADGASSGTLTPEVANSLLWAVGQTTEATNFLAVYPYETERPLLGDTEDEKYIDYAITDAASVDYADYFLAAATSQAPGTGDTPAAVSLAFKHPFTKLVYHVNNSTDDSIFAVKISGIRQTGHLMFTTGTVTPTGDPIAAANAASLVLQEGTVDQYQTVVMPESAAVNPLVVVEMNSGAKYSFALGSAITLDAGKVYSANITLDGGHGTETSDRTTACSFTVTDWESVDSGEMNGTGVVEADKWWYLEGNIDEWGGTTDGNWSKHVPFHCEAATVWSVDFYYAATETDVDHGFKIRHAADLTDWTEAYGKDVVIASASVKGDGEGDDYLVQGLSTSGTNIRIDAPGNYRIKFYTDTHDFHIYKLD